MDKVTLDIDGMSCGMCEAHVNDIIRRHFNVKKLRSSHRRGKSEFLTEDAIDEKKMADALGELGYRLLGIHREPYEKKGGLFHRG